jgi:hypothetical protein
MHSQVSDLPVWCRWWNGGHRHQRNYQCLCAGIASSNVVTIAIPLGIITDCPGRSVPQLMSQCGFFSVKRNHASGLAVFEWLRSMYYISDSYFHEVNSPKTFPFVPNVAVTARPWPSQQRGKSRAPTPSRPSRRRGENRSPRNSPKIFGQFTTITKPNGPTIGPAAAGIVSAAGLLYLP